MVAVFQIDHLCKIPVQDINGMIQCLNFGRIWQDFSQLMSSYGAGKTVHAGLMTAVNQLLCLCLHHVQFPFQKTLMAFASAESIQMIFFSSIIIKKSEIKTVSL